jgi:hypothetical protein
MGTWGTGLYSDDTACDVRDDYLDILGDGILEPEATTKLVMDWDENVSDPDVGPVFWLALADTQWNVGRLQDRVRQEALNVIKEGSDLSRWGSEQRTVNERKIILSKLEEKLKSPQPEIKKIKKRFISSTNWEIGEVYSFQLLSGSFLLFHVIGFHEDRGGKGPVCGVMDWIGLDIPARSKIKSFKYRYANEPYQHISQFLLGSLNSNDYPNNRIRIVTKRIKPKQPCGGYSVLLWNNIDKKLKDLFGID